MSPLNSVSMFPEVSSNIYKIGYQDIVGVHILKGIKVMRYFKFDGTI